MHAAPAPAPRALMVYANVLVALAVVTPFVVGVLALSVLIFTRAAIH